MKFKSWILFGLLLLALKGNAQVIKGAGVIYFDSMPNVNAALSGSELAYSIKMKKVFRWNRQNSTWVEISSDTTSLSNRINTKLNISDTTAMLSPYLKKADTTSLSNRINTKLNISDTSVFARDWELPLKLNISDTTAMLSPYLKKADTTSLSNRINTKLNISDTSVFARDWELPLKLNISDTTAMLSTYLKKADTTSLSNRINTKLNISDTSVFARDWELPLKLNISDTTAMLSTYLKKADTTSLSNRINLKRDTADVIPILKGGTGATTAAAARTNLLPTQPGNENKYLRTNGSDVFWDNVSGGSGTVTGTGAANKVAFWTDPTTLSNNSNFHWDNSNGRLGIGTSTPAATLSLSVPDIDQNLNGGFGLRSDHTRGFNRQQTVVAMNSKSSPGSGVTFTSDYTAQAFNMAHNGAGTSSFLTSLNVRVGVGGGGSVTDLVGLGILTPFQWGATVGATPFTGAITNLYGIRVSGSAASTANASITNNYGLYIQSPTTGVPSGTVSVSNDYSIYAPDAVQKAYIGGRVGIGTTSPVDLLHVNGTAIVDKLGVGVTNPFYTVDVRKPHGNAEREQVFRFGTTDSGNDAGYVGNATSGNGSWVTTFSGYTDSSPAQVPFQLRSMTSAANDVTDSSPYGLLDMAAFRTDNPTDPNNGLLSTIVNRKIFTVRSGPTIADVKFTILANNNVGIGTTAPQNLLHVAGSFRVDDAALSANPGFNATRIAAVDDNGRMRSIAIGAGLALNITTHTLSATGGTAGTVTVIGTPAVGQIAVWAGTSSIQGVNSLDVAKGGTGATTAADARTNLGLVIGTNVLAPNGSAAGLTNFPTLNQNTTGTATNVTGTVAITNGGTGATTAADARTNLGLVIGTNVLAPNGSAAGLTNFPTLNQNTTGTASNVTGTVAAANGGTGQSIYAIGDILYANTTTTLAKLSPSTAGRVLITNGSGQAPSWSDVGTAVTTLTTPTAISGSTTVTFNASGKPMAVFRQSSSSGATTTITSVTISNPVTGGVYSIHLPTPTGPANQVQVNWNTTTPAFKDLALTNLGTRYYTTATIITCYYDGTDFICK